MLSKRGGNQTQSRDGVIPHWCITVVLDYSITTSSIHITPCGAHSFILCSFLELLIFPPPNISFLRRFFASSVNPATMAAAKTKAQKIIDENAVGMNTRGHENSMEANTDMLKPSSASLTVPIAELLNKR